MKNSQAGLACSWLALAMAGALAPTLALAAQPAAQAGQSSGLQLGEVVVTAQRSAQNQQNVPISVNAVQSEQLQALQIFSTKDLDQVVPGLIMNRKAAAAVQPFIRGIGTSTSAAGVEATVATYVDGVYIPTPAGATFDLPDVARVEVLKGPQGTLFGRNAVSGALSVVTRDPSATPHLEAEATYANYQLFEGKAYLTGPLTEGLTGNLSLYYSDQGEGWGENTTGHYDIRKQRQFATRGKLQWKPLDNVTITAGANYVANKGDLTQFAALPGVLHRTATGTFVNPGFYDTVGASPYHGYDTKFYGGFLKAEVALGDFELINTAALQKLQVQSYTAIFGGTPFSNDPVLYGDFSDRTFSDELRLQYSDTKGNRLVTGLYYLGEHLNFGQFNFANTPPYTAGSIDDVDTASAAAFADGTYVVGGGFSITAGVRYTEDRRKLSLIQNLVPATQSYTTFPDRSLKTSRTTYRIVGQWKPTDDIMAYFSQSTGYKAGFFNLGGAAPTAPPLEPELMVARELGLKSELFDRRLRLNLALFRDDYTNIVVQQTVTVNGLTNANQLNAAEARTEGFEAEFTGRVTQDFTLSGGLSWMPTAKYTKFQNATLSSYDPTTGAVTTRVGDATGNRLFQAPEVEAQAQAFYTHPVEWGVLDLAGSIAYRSKIYFGSDNRVSQGPVTLLNASAKLTLPGDRYSITVWGKNLADKEYFTDAVQSAGVDIIIPGTPRTFGVTLRAVF